jgi:CBS domain-containing protein
MKASDVMTAKVLTVKPTTSVVEAVRVMIENRISGLPVTDDKGDLVGIVTEGDFLRRAETSTEKRRPRWLEFLMGPGRLAEDYVHTHARTVADVMTDKPYAVAEGLPLQDVVTLMETHGIKRVPVTREKKVVGIVSRANLLHALATVARTAPGPTTEDSVIREKLMNELEKQKWAPLGLLNIVVQGGVVDLWGSITDERQREAIIVAAQNTDGVKEVRDHLYWVEPMSGVALGPGGAILR